MILRDNSRYSRPPRRKRRRSAFRLDVNRASLLSGVLIGTLVSAAYFFVFRSEPPPPQDEFVFGKQTRVGSIVTVPISGDNCRQAAFNNDNGVIVPLGQISCVLVIDLAEARSNEKRPPDKFAVISDKFRK